jgi:hypothetical protein
MTLPLRKTREHTRVEGLDSVSHKKFQEHRIIGTMWRTRAQSTQPLRLRHTRA